VPPAAIALDRRRDRVCPGHPGSSGRQCLCHSLAWERRLLRIVGAGSRLNRIALARHHASSRLSNTFCCYCRRRSDYQLGKPPQVLRNRCKCELILSAGSRRRMRMAPSTIRRLVQQARWCRSLARRPIQPHNGPARCEGPLLRLCRQYLIDVLSQRRATRLLDVDRSTVRYRRKRKDDDADRKLLRALLVAPGVWPRIKT
jgi:hypothetical protein